MSADVPTTTRADWSSDQEVRWCPGCGDYSILAALQFLMPELGVRRENTVFVSGIGCAARFPYYMDTYGMHSIHGRAPAIATGLAMARPDLDVWVDDEGFDIEGLESRDDLFGNERAYDRDQLFHGERSSQAKRSQASSRVPTAWAACRATSSTSSASLRA